MRRKLIPLPTQERLKELLSYDPETGIFRWKVNLGRFGNATKIGQVAGCNSRGYVVIRVDRKLYFAQRLAWLFMTGETPNYVDHRNLDPSDNKWTNLRLATQSQNIANSPMRRNNTIGFKGVKKLKGRFYAKIKKDGKEISLGGHATPEEAHQAYCAAAKRLFGDFAHDGLLPMVEAA